MIITCIAHSMFLIELDNGLRIVTDPVGADSGYPVEPVKADAVLVSHQHHDHCTMGSVLGSPAVIDSVTDGATFPGCGIRAVHAWHDDAEGAKRGSTLLFLIEAEGLRVVHLGDLGTLPNKEQIAVLSPCDVLMTPVGGWFTIDAAAAAQTERLLGAHVVLPMHYKTEHSADWPISGPEAFTARYPAEQVSRQPLLRVTSEDLSCQKHVVLLQPQLKG